jgi:hypothetical protein
MADQVKEQMVNNYFGNVLTSFENGVQLDLRVRLAVDLMKDGGFTDPIAALDAATSLIAEADKRGLIKELPETGEINQPLRRHIDRSVRAQVHQQLAAGRIGQEEAPRVMPVGANGNVVATQ